MIDRSVVPARPQRDAREIVSLVVTVAAAFVAALFLSVETRAVRMEPASSHAGFEEARRELPVLDAIRVRSDDPDAVTRLRNARGRPWRAVLDPRNVGSAFADALLTRAASADVAALERQLRRRPSVAELDSILSDLPERPPVELLFRDASGPYRCDVMLAKDRRGAWVDAEPTRRMMREIVPDVRMSGETVARLDEDARRKPVTRGLLVSLAGAVLVGFLALRRRARSLRDLAATLTGLALLGVVGTLSGAGGPGAGVAYGHVDPWSVLAAVIVFAGGAPAAWALFWLWPIGEWSAAPSLGRVGILAGGALAVHVVGTWLDAWFDARAHGSPPRARPAVSVRPAAISTLVLAGFLALGANGVRADVALPDAVRFEPAVALGSRAALQDVAARGRERLWGPMQGELALLPPPVDSSTARRIRLIFQRASRYQRGALDAAERAKWGRLARAAAVTKPYLPRAVRERTTTQSGDAVLWIYGPVASDDAGAVVGARLARTAGQRALWRWSLAAGCVAFLAFGFAVAFGVVAPTRGAPTPSAVLAVAVGGAAVLLYGAWRGSAAPILPLGVAAAAAVTVRGFGAWLALAVGAPSAWIMAPALYTDAVCALELAATAALLVVLAMRVGTKRRMTAESSSADPSRRPLR